MEDPDAARPENREETPRSLVRPYVGNPDLDTERSAAATAGNDEADPWDGFYFPPEMPTAGPGGYLPPETSAVGPGGLLESARPRDQADQADENGFYFPLGRPAAGPGALFESAGSRNTADQAGEYTRKFPAASPAAAGPRRTGGGPRSARPAARRRTAALIVAVSGVATAGVIGLVLSGNPKGSPMAAGGASDRSGGAMPGTSQARGHTMMSTPATHATTPAASVSPTVSSPAPTTSQATSVNNPSAGVAPSLSPGSVISIEATTECCSTFSITHDGLDGKVVITHISYGSSASKRADATWIVRQGLADSACISLESADISGEYLNHQDFELFLGPYDGSADFASDATFCPQPGNSGQGYSFEAYNRPSWFIRHYRLVDYIANGTGGILPWNTLLLWHDDTTWKVVQPWS